MSLVSELQAAKKIMTLGIPDAEVARVKSELSQAKPLFCKLTDMFNGTSRFFAVVFTVCGIILAFKGHLTMEYVALVGSIQGLIVGHSIAQDYHERNSGGTDAAA